jgi:feruloyl-CoA synthase
MAEGLGAVKPPFKQLPMKAPDVAVERRADGAVYIRSNHPMGARPRSIPHLLDEKAKEHPARPFLRQREPGHGPWRTVSYAEAARASGAAAEKLRVLGLGPNAPLMVLSGNSIEHAILTLAAMKIRAPVAPISPPYSLMSADFSKLKHCFAVVKPKAVFVQSFAQYERALAALDLTGVEILSADDAPPERVIRYADLIDGEPAAAVSVEMDRITDHTIAKFLFTSGSTGLPKAVPQYQGAMCAQIAASEGLRSEPPDPNEIPQALDWMPWSHISGANVNFNGALWGGATLHIDEGKPLPGLFETTIKNLYEVSPIVFGSAPIAFAMLADAMERDEKLRKSFFKNLRYMGYGGATLSDDLYDRLQALAIAETGTRIPLTTMYGATETQGITVVHWQVERVGLIGLPLPGITLKLVPNGDKLEVRVKGPTVTTGYWGDEAKTREAFDEEGFYKLGDAARFLDEADPAQGLVFDGRVTEDFKLSSGTWVSVGTLRPDVVATCSPYVFDAVIAGQDKPFIGALIWPSPSGMAGLASESNPLAKLADIVKERLAAFNAGSGGSSRRIVRIQIMTEPPSIDAGEITDKGYVNQRATLARRQALVAALYAEPPGDGVIVIQD